MVVPVVVPVVAGLLAPAASAAVSLKVFRGFLLRDLAPAGRGRLRNLEITALAVEAEGVGVVVAEAGVDTGGFFKSVLVVVLLLLAIDWLWYVVVEGVLWSSCWDGNDVVMDGSGCASKQPPGDKDADARYDTRAE